MRTVMGVMNLAWAATAIVGPIEASALQQFAGSAAAYLSLGIVLLLTAIAADSLNRAEGLSAK